MKLKNLIILLLLIPLVVATPYRIDENLEMGENDVYNATNINSTNVYQSGNRVLDTSFNGSELNVNSSLYWDNRQSLSEFNIGNWTGDKGDYYTSVQTDSQIVAANDSIKSWVLLKEYYNHVNNLTAVLNSVYVSFSNIVSLVGNWSADKSDYYTSTETDTEIINANTSMKDYTDSTFITQANEGNLDVNSADYWDNLNSPSDISTGDLTDDNTYVQVTGDTMTGDLDVDADINIAGWYYINDSRLNSSHIPDHNGHSVKDTFEHIINRGVAKEITVSLTGGLGVNWTAGEVYDNSIEDFVTTDAGSGTLASDQVNYLKYTGTPSLELTTSSSSDDEILIARFATINGMIAGNREISLLDNSLSDTRRGLRTAFPNRIISGMSVSEDTDITNGLDVSMSAGKNIKDGINEVNPTAIDSRTLPLVRLFHSGGSWTNDNNAEIDTLNYDDGNNLVTIPSNKWVKSYFIYIQGKLGWVYPTAYYSVKAQAEASSLSPMPTGLTLAPKLTAIVYQQGDTDFTSTTWQDIRPGISEESFNIVTDHGSLAGLSDDDHPQYLLTDGNRELTGNWDAGDYNITASHFIGNGSQLTGLTLTETDPFWSSNHTNMQVDCGAGLYSYGVYSNGTLKCRVDSGTTYTAGTGLSLIGSEFSFNETYGDNRYITSESDPIFSAWDYSDLLNKSSDTYVVTESDPVYSAWNKFTGIPHATPSNGDVTHFSYADEIYDWVIGLGYSTTTGTVTNVATGNGLTGGPITTTGTISTSALTAGANQYSYWDGDSWEVRDDDDTTYSAGNGISLSTTTFSVAGGTGLTQEASGLKVTDNGIGNTQLEYDTGQHLTTISDVTFQNVTTNNLNSINCITFDSGGKICSGS